MVYQQFSIVVLVAYIPRTYTPHLAHCITKAPPLHAAASLQARLLPTPMVWS